jgi:aspartate racemase
MTTAEFLAKLADLNVKVSTDGDRLRCSAPKGSLTEDLRAELATRKAEIIVWLQQSQTASAAGGLPDLNATDSEYPRDRCIHALFAEQATATPEALAVIGGDEVCTYGELDRRARALAWRLRRWGVRDEQLVGVWMDRSVDAVVAILAILKAGGAYLPFDLASPPDRLAFMLADADVQIVLTHRGLASRLPPSPARIVCVDDELPAAEEPEALPDAGTRAESLAYVMYTSGSTGEPKGVAVTHRNVVRLVKGTDYARFGADEVFLLLAPLSFDASTFEMWGSLLNGGRLVVGPAGVPGIQELGRVLSRHGVTTVWLTAGLFHQIVDHGIEALRGLRQLLAGGDVLSVSHVRRVLAELPGCTLINGYGPTEGTTFTCCHTVTEESARAASVPIGRPIANTRAYIMDQGRRPVPVGSEGELWIGGDGVARGYLRRPELTAERFVLHRFETGREERLYRTGDIVRCRPDGALEFVGRVDNQVKIRGFRVELGEIESALAQWPPAAEVVVVAREERSGERSLAAYLRTRGPAFDHDACRTFLRERLPAYMVPATFTRLERFPLNVNGKVDRRRLPVPDSHRIPSRDTRDGPGTEVERTIADAWRAALGTDDVGMDENFFDVGGHSLMLVRVQAQLQSALGFDIPVVDMFQYPTIRSLAAHLAGTRPAA